MNLNLSVEVQEHDYKPVLWVALEQNNKDKNNVNSNDSTNNKSNDANNNRINYEYIKQPVKSIYDQLLNNEFVNQNYVKLLIGNSDNLLSTSDNQILSGEAFYACDAGCLDPPIELRFVEFQYFYRYSPLCNCMIIVRFNL